MWTQTVADFYILTIQPISTKKTAFRKLQREIIESVDGDGYLISQDLGSCSNYIGNLLSFAILFIRVSRVVLSDKILTIHPHYLLVKFGKVVTDGVTFALYMLLHPSTIYETKITCLLHRTLWDPHKNLTLRHGSKNRQSQVAVGELYRSRNWWQREPKSSRVPSTGRKMQCQ